MANPIAFKLKPANPKQELQRRLDAAPVEHAEALLVAYDLLETAHRQGILDALHGAIGAKDTIAGLLAEYSIEPISVHAIRNALSLAKMLGSLPPETLSRMSKNMAQAVDGHQKETPPPRYGSLSGARLLVKRAAEYPSRSSCLAQQEGRANDRRHRDATSCGET